MRKLMLTLLFGLIALAGYTQSISVWGPNGEKYNITQQLSADSNLVYAATEEAHIVYTESNSNGIARIINTCLTGSSVSGNPNQFTLNMYVVMPNEITPIHFIGYINDALRKYPHCKEIQVKGYCINRDCRISPRIRNNC